jgi:predicted aspartyl protease
MKKLVVEDGLLLTDMKLTFRERTLSLERVLVDTGSGSTIVSTDWAESIGIVAEENDMIYRISGVGGSEFVYSKTIDSIRIGEREVVSFPLEIGAMNYGFDLNGIIGLDLLQQIRAIININKLTLDWDG